MKAESMYGDAEHLAEKVVRGDATDGPNGDPKD